MSTANVLVVDDDEATRALMRALLEHNGYRCDLAGNGAAGLALMRSGTYDVVLLDLILPDMSGFDILREMRLTPLSRMMPRTIVITAAADRTFSNWDDLDRTWCILRKPIDIEELLEEIGYCLQQARPTDRKPPARAEARPQRPKQKAG